MNNRWQANQDLIFETKGKRITVYDTGTANLYTLNQTASYIFKQLKTGKSIETISKAMQKHYNIAKQQADRDLMALVKEFLAKHILVNHPNRRRQSQRINKDQQATPERPGRQPK